MVLEAGVAVAGLIAEKTPEGKYPVHSGRVEEVLADKGYHSNDVVAGLADLELRTYIAEPERGKRNWKGKQAEKEAMYANPQRIEGERGKRLQRQRGERIERNFAHQFDTAGMDRLWVRGKDNAHKKFLLQAAACNPALLMRSLYGAGKPRAAHDEIVAAVLAILTFIETLELQSEPPSVDSSRQPQVSADPAHAICLAVRSRIGRFRHGLLTRSFSKMPIGYAV